MVRTHCKVKKKPFRYLKNDLPFHLMLLPAVVVVVIFRYIPMGGLAMAFQDYSPIFSFTEQEWGGFENFEYLMSMPQFWRVLRNTVVIASMKIVGDMAVPVIFALLLSEVRNKAYKSTIQTVVFYHILSPGSLCLVFLSRFCLLTRVL